MDFVNPFILWALVFGLTPLIIYYLMRYRSLRVPWGANYVLEQALERLRKKWHIEQLILIAIRTLACLLLVLAFARPISRATGANISGSGQHHIIIADASYSMRAGERGETRWDRAKDAMKKLVSSWGRGEKWSVLLLGHSEKNRETRGTWVVDGATVQSGEQAVSRIDKLQPGDSSSSIEQAMQNVRKTYGNDKLDVYLFSDDQATAWKGYEKLAGQNVDGLLTDTSGRTVSVSWMNPPLRDRTNLAVTEVRLPSDVVLSDHPTRVYVSVKNFSAKPARNVDVSILRDGNQVEGKSVSLLPGQTRSIHADVFFDSNGSHLVSTQLSKDVLPYDNEMSGGITVRDELSVLALQDKNVKGNFTSAWNFLERMKQVQTYEEGGRKIFRMGPVNFTVCKGSCSDENWSGKDVVLLDGSKSITSQLIDRLQSWLNTGGGLILLADGNADRQKWNRILGKAELLPARLGRWNTQPLGKDRFRSLSRARFEHPALRTFKTKEFGDVAEAKIYGWRSVEPTGKDTRTLMEYDDQTPFILSKKTDPGRSILLTAGVNGANNNLVVREFYVPLIFRIVEAAASGSVYPRTLNTGEELRLRLTDPENLNTVAFRQEETDLVQLEPVQKNGIPEVRHTVNRSGTGTVELIRPGSNDQVKFGIQGKRGDSDLRPMGDELRSTLDEAGKITEVKNWDGLKNILKEKSRGSEWYHWILISMLLLLFSEMVMELRFI